MHGLRIIAAVFVMALSSAVFAQQDIADELLAPLPVREQFLLNNGFLFFAPEQAGVLHAGVSRVALTAADSNTFAKSAWISRSLQGQTHRVAASEELANSRFHLGEPIFLVDGETHRFDLSFNHGFGANLELGVSVPITRIGGGWADEIIEVTHHRLGIGNAEREALQRNVETVYLQAGRSQYLRVGSVGFELGDIALTGKYELPPLEERAVFIALAWAIQLPTGDARTLSGSGSFDAGVQLVASRDFPDTRVHAAIGILRLGANRPLGTSSQALITNTVAISHRLNDRMAATVQVTVSESPFRHVGIPEFTRRSNQLAAGIRHEIGRSFVAYAAFIENLFNYENSADAGFAWGVVKRF